MANVKAKKKVVIAGGGVAGLSTGCYALMNGYDAEIHEAQSRAGGLCTDWRRGPYTFDGCIHWLTGSGPGNGLHSVWRELGAVQGKRMFDRDIFARVRSRDGRIFEVFADPERLRSHMKQISPVDASAIDRLCDALRAVAHLDMGPRKPEELKGAIDKLKQRIVLARSAKTFVFLGGTKFGEFAAGLEDPFLRKVFAVCFYGFEDYPLIPLAFTLAPLHRRAAGFPEGGSAAFAKGIEKRFLDLGGKLVLGSRVERILEENGRAVGLVAGGREVRADYVVSAMDMKTTLERLLGGRRGDETHRVLFESGSLMDPALQVSLGVAIDLSNDTDAMGEILELPEPVRVGGRDEAWIGYRHFSFDPSFAPAGKSAITVFFRADWAFWDRLRSDRAAYDAEKSKVLEVCIKALERRFPGFRSKIEQTDVATPLTFERYCGNWRGAYMTWSLDRDFRRKYGYIRKTVPGLSNFWFASMWTDAPGGLPGAAMAGRNVIQLLCAQEKKQFRTSEPGG
jgi:phytoene dehydrogenase-like protein